MRKVILYIATSLEGFIARENGSVDWLPMEAGEDYGYAEFFASIDTVLMGRATYEQILGFDVEYPYKDKKSFVFTQNPENVVDGPADKISKSAGKFVRDLKLQPGGDIWLVGGASLFNTLLAEELVDELIIFTIPILIGSGIPLFNGSGKDRKLTSLEHKAYPSGAVKNHVKIQY